MAFNGSALSASFNFVGSHKLQQVDVFNAVALPASVTVSCGGQPLVTAIVGGGQTTTIRTNWTGTCASVTLGSTTGSSTKFDNFVVV